MASINPTADQLASSFPSRKKGSGAAKSIAKKILHTFISSPTLEILLKSLRHFEDFGDMCHAKGNFFIDGKGLCSTNSIFNLSQTVARQQHVAFSN